MPEEYGWLLGDARSARANLDVANNFEQLKPRVVQLAKVVERLLEKLEAEQKKS